MADDHDKRRAKRSATKERPAARERAASGKKSPDGTEMMRLLGATLAGHEAAIRQLAEVVVNLHDNVRALREVADALTADTADKHVRGAAQRLRRMKLDE